MSKRIHYTIEFYFNRNQELRLLVSAKWDDEAINLSHSAFLLFLYNNEDDIPKKEADFAYRLAKRLKKLRIGDNMCEGLSTEEEVAWFFIKSKEFGIQADWRYKRKKGQVRFEETIPIEILVRQTKTGLICGMRNHAQWLNSPLDWITLKSQKDLVCFIQGRVIFNPQPSILKFLDQFIQRKEVKYSGDKVLEFIQQVYQPNKKKLKWRLRTRLNRLLPKETPPVPSLHLIYDGLTLRSTISYRYGSQEVTPDIKDDMVQDKVSGKIHKRQTDVETRFQDELMNMFIEHEIPFLLQNPGDIATLLDQVVPILKSRDWEVKSDTDNFKVEEDPLEFNFNLNSNDKDWFFFEPNTTIDGKEMTFHEIARLMIDNSGYIKTEKGFIKIDDQSKRELEVLDKMGAFDNNKKFNKAEILPLIASTHNLETTGKASKSLVERFRDMQKCTAVTPGKGFNGELRDYQQYGVNWINFLYANGLGGILADDMGLGKTVQVIAFCNQVKEPGPVLVIGPTNVLYNWQNELSKFTTDKKSVVYTGPNRYDLLKKIPETDFIITSFGILKNDIDILSEFQFKAVFVDEAQHIKNPNTLVSKAIKQLMPCFRLAMTGTPIENYIQDLWNIFDFIMPNYLGTARHFEIESKEGRRDQLKAKIRPFVLRREKREVLSSLPEKTEITLKCDMSESQRKLYETVLKAAKEGIRDSVGKSQRLNVLTALLKLRQVCIHPGLLKEFRGEEIPSAKFDLVKEKIVELIAEGHKIVLFSQFTEMLDFLERWTSTQNMYVERIDGSVSAKARMDAVDRYQESDQAGIFLISLKAGGVGLNLTAADYVIHLDPWWNPAIESQATDRVHRMGQQNKVIVYKMITEGTIEEKIQELQDSKRQLLGEIIDIDSAVEKKLDFDEIRNLLLV